MKITSKNENSVLGGQMLRSKYLIAALALLLSVAAARADTFNVNVGFSSVTQKIWTIFDNLNGPPSSVHTGPGGGSISGTVAFNNGVLTSVDLTAHDFH
jgi:hypothetical protein